MVKRSLVEARCMTFGEEKMVKVCLNMPPALLARLKAAARRKGLGYQVYMRELIAKALQAGN